MIAKNICYLMVLLAVVAAPSASAHTNNEYAELEVSGISGSGLSADQLYACGDEAGSGAVSEQLAQSTSDSQTTGFDSEDSCCRGVCTIAYLNVNNRAADRTLPARYEIGRFRDMLSADASGLLHPPRH